MKPVARQGAPWAQDDSESGQAPSRAVGKQDAPWAHDEDDSVYRQPNNAYGAGVRAVGAPNVVESAVRHVPKAPQGQNAPWAKDEDSSIYQQPVNGYGAGLHGHENRPPPGNPQPRRPVKGQGDSPWAQDNDQAVYRPAPNAYGAGVQMGGGEAPPPRRGGHRTDAGDDAYLAPANGYGAGQEDGGLQAHLDAKQSARAIRTKMSGAGNVLSWS